MLINFYASDPVNLHFEALLCSKYKTTIDKILKVKFKRYSYAKTIK